jgi:putative DNA methylase
LPTSFYVWLRLVLKGKYPDQFSAEYTPKTLEAVSNRARNPDDADAYYQRLLTASWKEAHRILKPGGTLAFTFHHSEDDPWVSVLESLCSTPGFYLEATYPIRSDETKGDGEFGSRKIEYDIVHVCRKRTEEPSAVSWAKMRRQVLQDVRALKHMLEHHQKAGLPEADLQVIRRGKALEYFSRHYGKVFVDEGSPMRVIDALVGINQLLDEETGGVKNPPPVNAEPFTRQFLRLFDGLKEIPRDQIQKFLRGTGIAPSDFEARGWCSEDKKIFHLTSPLDVARAWQGKHRRGMTSDYDQATFFIGACFENSGINANETLTNENFKPHPALSALLDWFATRGATSEIRNAASRAQSILRAWRAKHESPKNRQRGLFSDDDGDA